MSTLIAKYKWTTWQYTDNIYNWWQRFCGNSFLWDWKILDSCNFYLSKIGSPTGSMFAYVYAHTWTFWWGWTWTWSILATSDAIDVTTVIAAPSFWKTTFTFSWANKITLTNWTYYVIWAWYSGGNGSDRIDISISNLATKYWNNSYINSSSIWSAYATLCTEFEVYWDTSSAIKSINWLAKASVKTINWLAVASVKTANWLA